jgi:hypothetical protein
MNDQKLNEFLSAISLPTSGDNSSVIISSLRQRYIRALERALSSRRNIDGDVLEFIDRNMSLIDQSSNLLQVGIGIADSPDISQCSFFAQTLLLLTTLGGIGNWTVTINRPYVAYMGANPILLEDNVSCSSDGNQATITVGDHSQKTYERRGAYWIEAGSPEPLKLDNSPLQCQIFAKHNLVPDKRLFGDIPLCSVDHSVIEETVREAFEMISKCDPDSVNWLDIGLKGIIFLEAPSDRSFSGSAISHPGLIYATFPMDADMLAALIVHETAHQYFRMCEYHFKIVNRVGETVYSPFKKTERPVQKVMLALHAAVNIKRFTGKLLASGHESDYIHAEDKQLASDIVVMKENLHNASSVTAEGRRFIEIMCA